MDFEEFSKETVKQINKELDRLLGEWRGEVGRIDRQLLPLVDKFIDSCQGGKRIRGSLVVLGYEIAKKSSVVLPFGGPQSSESLKADSEATPKAGEAILKTESSIIKIAAAYEIFHTAILAHDDIIDQSPIRRGQPSLYQALGGNHDGISQAICLGDAGFFLAVKIIAESSFPDKEKIAALKWFGKTMLDTAMGEMLDVRKGDVTAIMKFKTARYSVSGPLQIGAILAGVKLDQLDKLDQFGEALGIAFQIQDDILGVFGSAEQTGKSIASDIEEGKNTLLYNYALKKADSSQQQTLAKYYGKGVQGVRGIMAVKKVFEETEALDYAKKEAEKYKNKALKVLPKITGGANRTWGANRTKDPKMSKLLEQMVEYLVERKK